MYAITVAIRIAVAAACMATSWAVVATCDNTVGKSVAVAILAAGAFVVHRLSKYK